VPRVGISLKWETMTRGQNLDPDSDYTPLVCILWKTVTTGNDKTPTTTIIQAFGSLTDDLQLHSSANEQVLSGQ